MSIQQVIDNLKGRGYDVYGPAPLTTYVYFTDGKRIGYVQYADFSGVKYTTVHRPNRRTGTGFEAVGASQALDFAPHWASQSDRESVEKYENFEVFRARHWQPLVKY
jgi:hypothetical protein